jgi:hypothetical protein
VPYKLWIPGEEVLSADFNDYVQEQVVATFPTAAARTAALVAPNVGQPTHLTDSGTLEVWTDKTSPPSWRKPWNSPWGIVVPHTGIAGSQAVGGIQYASGFPITLTGVPIGRRLRFTGHLTIVRVNATNADVTCSFQRDGTVSEQYAPSAQTIGSGAGGCQRLTWHVDAVFVTTKASQTCGMLHVSSQGSGQTSEGGYYSIEDIGI